MSSFFSDLDDKMAILPSFGRFTAICANACVR